VNKLIHDLPETRNQESGDQAMNSFITKLKKFSKRLGRDARGIFGLSIDQIKDGGGTALLAGSLTYSADALGVAGDNAGKGVTKATCTVNETLNAGCIQTTTAKKVFKS